MAEKRPNASYSFTVRVKIPSAVGSFVRVANAISDAGGDLGAIDIVSSNDAITVRDITVGARDANHATQIVERVRQVVPVVHVSDRTFLVHLGGKLETRSRVRVEHRDDLSMIYTPGVARVCRDIAENPSHAWNLTMRGRTVMILTDGTRVLGLGDIGPKAALPVMEGKAILFKNFGGVDAWPVCVDTKDTEEIIKIAKALAPNYGAINLEDIASPKCFEIERRLREELDIPVFHDDRHGTAIAVLAGLYNACRVTMRELTKSRVVVIGAGAAGSETAKLLLAAGVENIVMFDSQGPIHQDREDLNKETLWAKEKTNPENYQGDLAGALVNCDIVIGLAAPNIITTEMTKKMAENSIVFALSNPDPEIYPEDVSDQVAVMATGRSDYPNQINNALVFPGFFRGLLSVHARGINDEMKLAAARAIANIIPTEEVGVEYIIPSIFNQDVAKAVAQEVAEEAARSNLARRVPNEFGEIR